MPTAAPLDADQVFWLLDLVRKQTADDGWKLIDVRLQDMLLATGWAPMMPSEKSAPEYWTKTLAFPGQTPVNFTVKLPPRFE